jgi:hypothetical protein
MPQIPRSGEHNGKCYIVATDDSTGLAYNPKHYIVYVDVDDLTDLLQYHWFVDKDLYIVRHERQGRSTRTIRMHRHIMQAEKGQEVDHKDGQRRNNTRDNLRFASRQQQVHNTKTFKDGGVSQRKDNGKWRARIKLKGFNGGKEYTIGNFSTKDEAKAARDSFVEQKLKELGHNHD